MKPELQLLLVDIRSVHNVGSIFRTADAAGVSKIYLCGTTPTPLDRFGRERKDLAKVSLGAEKTVGWQYAENATELINFLKKEKLFILALEQSDTAVDYKKVELKKMTVLVLGNEVEGIHKEVLSLCDAVCEIPMKGKKESLNVSVAAGVALFNFTDQLQCHLLKVSDGLDKNERFFRPPPFVQ